MALFSFERTSSPKAASLCAQQQQPTSPSSATTATSTDSATSSYKRAFASDSSSIPELPLTVAWLEHTTLDMSATVGKSFTNCNTEFTLKVSYFDASIQQSALTWRVHRSFDEYVEFQQRLLKTLALGHACSAECRWLHSFVKNYFPKKARFFGNCSTRTTNVRREKLGRCLNVLKASLLNRGNHGCAIVALQLAGEFDAFIHGNNRFAAVTADVVRRRSRTGSIVSDTDDESDQLEKLRRHSNASSTSTDAGDHEQQQIADLVNVCDLCDNSLDEAPDTSLATLDAIVNSRSSSRSIDSVDSSVVSNVFSCHTTTLSCGHQFHDECVLPELAALGYRCPSCNAPQNI